MTNQIQISMNYKNILIHTKFPRFDTDTLNCMEENSTPLPQSPIISNPGNILDN